MDRKYTMHSVNGITTPCGGFLEWLDVEVFVHDYQELQFDIEWITVRSTGQSFKFSDLSKADQERLYKEVEQDIASDDFGAYEYDLENCALEPSDE